MASGFYPAGFSRTPDRQIINAYCCQSEYAFSAAATEWRMEVNGEWRHSPQTAYAAAGRAYWGVCTFDPRECSSWLTILSFCTLSISLFACLSIGDAFCKYYLYRWSRSQLFRRRGHSRPELVWHRLRSYSGHERRTVSSLVEDDGRYLCRHSCSPSRPLPLHWRPHFVDSDYLRISLFPCLLTSELVMVRSVREY